MDEREKLVETLFVIEGDLVSANIDELRGKLRGLVDSQKRQLIVLDMEKSKMIDSSGIGLVIALHNSLAKMEDLLN